MYRAQPTECVFKKNDSKTKCLLEGKWSKDICSFVYTKLYINTSIFYFIYYALYILLPILFLFDTYMHCTTTKTFLL
ncbi:hypothetical protein HanRHA438_Chr08g0337521 [Helianthus annuus]|nr:hypothetical protein HanIR_Chr08g0352641 [Helianthus annuus]KAJ0896699.1 hypothetical protein HanRHA438_Chr08g0337521 [Helianthus annuus]